MRLYSICMNTVIELGKSPVKIPREGQSATFIFLQATEFLDQIDLELRTDPHPKLKSNIRMSICAAISSGCGFESNGIRLFNPFLDTDLVSIKTSLTSNYGKFAIIKIGIKNRLPNAEELHRVAVS